MSLKEKLMNSLFLKTFNLIKKQPKFLIFALAFDFLFVASVYGIGFLMGVLIPANIFSAGPLNAKMILAILLPLIVYPLILLLAYSFFKHVILNFVKSLINDEPLSFKRFSEFYFLNLIIFSAIGLVTIVIGIFLRRIANQQAFSIVYMITITLIFIFSYTWVNISHSIFTDGKSIKETILKSYMPVFNKIHSYLPVIIFSVIFLLAFNGVFYILAMPFKSWVFSHPTAYATIFKAISFITIYLTFMFNRLYFYLITKEKLGSSS